VVASKNIQTYKYGEKQQKAKEKTANKCRLHVWSAGTSSEDTSQVRTDK